jgi:hypothetical protein
MKKLIACISGLYIFSAGYCQEAIRFTMGILPNIHYDNIVTQSIKIELNLDSSSAEIISKMEANGMKNPTVQEQETRMEAMVKSGAINKQSGKMPVTTSIISSDEKISKLLTPETRFIGTARLNELPVYDSITGINLDVDQKVEMLKLISSMTQFTLPNKHLKPGESDTLHTPIVIPVAGVNLKMDYVTIYLLKSVKGKMALFDVHVNFNLNMEVKDLPVEGFGSGDGLMEYDLKNQYPTNYKLTYLIKMRIAKEGLILHMNMKSDLTSTCKIQAA